MDALSSFQHLLDNIEAWKSSVTALSAYTKQKHEEFVDEYVQLLDHVKPKHTKSPSLTSIHSTSGKISQKAHKDPSSTLRDSNAPDLTEISPLEAGNSLIYAQATRKRKAGTSIRSGASGPARFRNKQMAIIRYDGRVQADLDATFKTFGIARNNLRKGKNTRSASKGFQLPSLGSRYDRILPGLENGQMRMHTMSRSMPKLVSKQYHVDNDNAATPKADLAFVKADKLLELSQNTCETAAHQFIRDGDCVLELDNILKNLDELLILSQSTTESLKLEEEERKCSSGVSSSDSDVSTLMDSDIDAPTKQFPGNHNFPTTVKQLQVSAPPPNMSAPNLAADIEVDDDQDDSESSIEIDISQFRRTLQAPRIRA